MDGLTEGQNDYFGAPASLMGALITRTLEDQIIIYLLETYGILVV